MESQRLMFISKFYSVKNAFHNLREAKQRGFGFYGPGIHFQDFI